MRKVNIYYGHLSQGDFDKFLGIILEKLKDNDNFPALPVALDDISLAKSNWLKELAKSQSGDHVATENARIIHDDLVNKVRRDGNYINDTAQGDVTKLETSGYTLAKEAEYEAKPDIDIVQDKISGAGNIVIEPHLNTICYLVEICADPLPAQGNTSVWGRLPLSSRSTIPFSGLDPRKLYWVRYCYLTNEGEAPYSQPKSFSVL
jgi:hypothetical protein